MTRESPDNVGIGRSNAITYTIPSGATSGGEINLGRNYVYIIIYSANMAGVQATTTMSAKMGIEEGITLADVYERDTPGTKWVSGNLPTSGTIIFTLVHAIGAQYLQLVLSKVTTQAVAFRIYGFGESLK